MNLTRRAVVKGIAATTAATGTALAAPAVLAQGAYPGNRTIKIVVPFTVGGATDIVGRLVADRLSSKWKTPVIVENVPGAGANIGNQRVAKGPTDGSQLVILSPSVATNQFLYSQLDYDPEKDLAPLCQVVSVPNLLCVRNTLEVKSTADLVAYARANPGKLNFASSGVGTTLHLSGELFNAMAGTKIVHVAYKGSAPAINDLMGGNVDLIFDNISSIIGQARQGTVKPLAITTAKRSSLAPEYPPIADALPGYDTTSWFGVGAPAGTPKEIRDIIERDTRAACQEPIVKERLASLVAETVGSSAAEFTAYITAERTKWGKLITGAGIHVD
jgi:tripartite-type tricarboxylate transporter receptor subunit TctC